MLGTPTRHQIGGSPSVHPVEHPSIPAEWPTGHLVAHPSTSRNQLRLVFWETTSGCNLEHPAANIRALSRRIINLSASRNRDVFVRY